LRTKEAGRKPGKEQHIQKQFNKYVMRYVKAVEKTTGVFLMMRNIGLAL
jgi:protein-disulfide isomerase-like protein with CxxC motif